MRLPPLLASVWLGLVLAAPSPAEPGESGLDLATTTSVRDSGLLDSLLPGFREETGIHVRVIAVGTGAALRMGVEGNADILLTHAPAAEEELVESGAVLGRLPFMENHFVIAGPAEDPAVVRGASSAVDAFRRMARANAGYVSRSDDSGTHKREVALMEEAGLDAGVGWDDVTRTGSGMGLSLMVAGERRAYILSDIGTFLAFEKRIGLVIHSRPESALRNVYSLLRVAGERFAEPGAPIETENAKRLEAFLTRESTQQQIASFGRARFGRPLFRPLLLDERGAVQPAEANPKPAL